MKKNMFILTVFMAQFMFPTGVSIAESTVQTEKLDVITTIASPKIAEAKPISDWFPDLGLAQAVATEMNLEINDTVTEEDLGMLTQLFWANGVGIENLEGIQYLTSARSVHLANNNIKDISLLKELPNLDTELDLYGNQIEDISALSELETISALLLDDNQISDLSPLIGLKAEAIALNHNLINDISPLASLNPDVLISIELWGNNISDISPLAALSNLLFVSIGENHIRDISFLSNLPLIDLNAYGQTIIEEPILITSIPHVLTNPISDLENLSVAPIMGSISLDGVYEGSQFKWTTLENMSTLSFEWSHHFTPNNNIDNYGYFGGTYSQPYVLAIPGGNVTVTHKDYNGIELASSEILLGNLGESFETEPKEIPGWTVKTSPENATGVFTDEPQTVAYVYERAEAAPVTVTYSDESGNELAPSDLLTGKIGELFETEPKEIPGWVVKTSPENATGLFSDEPQTVAYVYERAEAAPVTVTYSDESGNELAPSDLLTGKIGESFETEAREIPGWKLVRIPNNATGIFNKETQYVGSRAPTGNLYR